MDYVKLNIFDYPQIVKKPMDFGTIKKKLTYNVYHKAKDFTDDMNLVFSNCTLYNGLDNPYGKTALELKSYFEEQVAENGLVISEEW